MSPRHSPSNRVPRNFPAQDPAHPSRPDRAVLFWFALALLIPSAHADTWRCGTKLVSDGDIAISVRDKCGDPISEELIGYTLRPGAPGFRGDREYKIEQWVYGPEQGYYHVLTFEAGRLRDIDTVKR